MQTSLHLLLLPQGSQQSLLLKMWFWPRQQNNQLKNNRCTSSKYCLGQWHQLKLRSITHKGSTRGVPLLSVQKLHTCYRIWAAWLSTSSSVSHPYWILQALYASLSIEYSTILTSQQLPPIGLPQFIDHTHCSKPFSHLHGASEVMLLILPIVHQPKPTVHHALRANDIMSQEFWIAFPFKVKSQWYE